MINKTVDCILGLQYGSEGKGKITSYLSKEYKAIVRSGGPQAGHTFYHKNIKYINRQIPCGVFSNCSLYIPSGALINLKVLEDEIKRYSLDSKKLFIDNNALIITSEHIKKEKEKYTEGFSTFQGVGQVRISRIERDVIFFKECKSPLNNFRENVSEKLFKHLKNNEKILLEGTQGFGLSLLHSPHFPYVTSDDTTASTLFRDAGISPLHAKKIIGVLRTYPIRIAGDSGKTGTKEINWKEIKKRANYPDNFNIEEFTSVTKKKRRVFEQDYDILKQAIRINQPTKLALMHIDYINFEDFGKSDYKNLSKKSKKYIEHIENILEVKVYFIGTGPKEKQLIDLR